MKRTFPLLLAGAVLAALLGPAAAQFSSGSDGSLGELLLNDWATTTVDLPADGILRYTTINVGYGARLHFRKNAANTPVYLLATGDVLIRGYIHAEGSDASGIQPGIGGPGGFDGGHGGLPGENLGGWGAGPGGGKPGTDTADAANYVGAGSYATRSSGGTSNEQAHQGPVYGTPLLLPLIGGSGGGGSNEGKAGGGGGGAILIASDTSITIDGTHAPGTIFAQFGAGAAGLNHGSGGAIRLVAPRVRFSAPYLYATRTDVAAGHGYIRIDTLDASEVLNQTSRVYGSLSIGKNMIVFPPSLPTIEITSAAGQAITPAQSTSIALPAGAAATQPVQVRVANFGGTAKLKVVLTPERGDRKTYDLDVVNPGPNPAIGTANVQFPGNMVTRIDVWTR